MQSYIIQSEMFAKTRNAFAPAAVQVFKLEQTSASQSMGSAICEQL